MLRCARIRCARWRYSVYLLYWYKGTNTDAAAAADHVTAYELVAKAAAVLVAKAAAALALTASGQAPGVFATQFTCCTSTKVQIRTPEELKL